MSDRAASDLIDRIYECSVAPELWPAVLDDLAGVAEARGGLVFAARKSVCWTASERVTDLFEEYFRDGWFGRCSRRVCSAAAVGKPTFFVEEDFWTPEQLADDPLYRDLFRPHGVGWSTWTGMRLPTGDEIVVSLERPFDRGPIERELIERLNVIRPHLVRAALVSARLGLQRVKGATETLAALGLPALLIDEMGRVMEASPMIGSLGDLVRTGRDDRLILPDPKANARLAEALAEISTAPGAGSSTFSVRDEAGRPGAVLHMMPLRRSAYDILGGSFALLVFTPVNADRAPSLELMQSLFGLTAAEARVARGVSMGRTLEDIAKEGGVAMTTVRSQLRRVLEKTGCGRQVELAAVLARMPVGKS